MTLQKSRGKKVKHLLFSSDQNRIMLCKWRAGARPEFSHVAVVLESLMKNMKELNYSMSKYLRSEGGRSL